MRKREKKKVRKREEKKKREEFDMIRLADPHYGIPLRCWCTAPIIEEVSPIPKYPTDCHTFPRSRYFICMDFGVILLTQIQFRFCSFKGNITQCWFYLQEYGLHFRRPLVIIVLEEVQRLRKRLNKMADEIEEIKKFMSRCP